MENLENRKESSFTEMAEIGNSAFRYAENIVRSRFETNRNLEQRLAYHNWEHTSSVVLRALAIGDAMGLGPRDKLLLQIAASFHDSVQDWRPDQKKGLGYRQRQSGANESASAEEAIVWMKEQKQNGQNIFTEDEYNLVREAIVMTVPRWDEARHTMLCPALTAGTSPIVRALALADLGSAAMESVRFEQEGDQVFLEDYLEIANAIRSFINNTGGIDDATKMRYVDAYKKWLDDQVLFAKGRRDFFEQEIDGLDESAKSNLRKLFSHFDTSIKVAQEKADAAKSWNFEQTVDRLKVYLSV
ncbi:MAG TPA: HD domain-containing protein [Candidatus Paceibacterota bacterium]|nr:HD domain-containing protein [Candidatus Paceibacterota bacterium]